jgi:hypothetical protein
MDIPTDLSGILSMFGLPAGAVALGYGLVRGAEALEADAKEERLGRISELLKKGPLTSFGPLGAAVVPFIFRQAFGQHPFSVQFIIRSIMASVVVWLIVCATKHFNVSTPFLDTNEIPLIATLILGLIVFVADWLSLTKASYILRIMPMFRITSIWTIIFVGVDVLFTYLIDTVSLILITIVIIAQYGSSFIFAPDTAENFVRLIEQHLFSNVLRTIISYIIMPDVNISIVLVTSTMLTSVWVMLFLLSSILAGLIYPLEYIRRFTLWWFDIDKHPLKAIAKVAAALIVAGALILKAVRREWGIA